MELPELIIVLVQPETPGNVGFVARAMANFGISNLSIVGADPREDEQARIYSVHALDILESAEIFPDLPSALEGTHVAWAATARAGGNLSVTRAVVSLTELPDPTSLNGKVALVFGRESSGLTNEEIDACDLVFSIPTSARYPSINLSHAVAVTLYDLFVRYVPKRKQALSGARPATRQERDQVCKFIDEVMDCLPIPEHRKPIMKRVFRNLLSRSYITGREAFTMTGFARVLRDLVLEKDKDYSAP
ncbi:MAG: rRNA methyltransferase [Candidatus Thorarchaeota archaeon]|nr:MAG: rRNA methyltransferase [Candidatus Thorarchaeota archaeon]